MNETRHVHELEHGKYLASGKAEEIWGWGTAAGRIRAARRADLILKGAGIGPSDRVVEIGCGTGLFTEMFAGSGAEIIAVDLSPDLLEIARRRHLPMRVRFVEENFENCILDGPFDAVIGSSVLHHLGPRGIWNKIYALLKPGGRMSFAEPNMLNPQIFCERHFRGFFPSVSPDETAFVRFHLKRELIETGFIPVSIRPFDWLHPSTPKIAIPILSTVGKLVERLPGAREFAGSLHIRAVRPA